MGNLCLNAVELLKNYGEGIDPKSQLGVKIERASAFLIDLYHEAFYPNTYNPRPDLKLTVWSEKDCIMLNDIINLIKQGGYVKSISEHYITWLKDLKDRIQPQPKQEWSEEDETNASYICAALDCYYRLREERNNTNGQEDLDKARNWLYNKLKSLKPQSQFKPSDEQMEALERMVNFAHFNEVDNRDIVRNLLSQLKKLMEE